MTLDYQTPLHFTYRAGELASETKLAEAAGHAMTQWLPMHGDFVPRVIEIAKSAGVDPLAPALGATLGASMIRYGLLLDVVGAIVIIGLVWLIAPLVR